MSEAEKGAIVRQMASLPPLLKAKAEGYVDGLKAATANYGKSGMTSPAAEGHKSEEVENG